MLREIIGLLISIQFAEHHAILHIVSVYDRSRVFKIRAAAVIQKDTARDRIFFFVGLKEILLIVHAQKYGIIHLCTLNENPTDHIFVHRLQCLKIYRWRYPFRFRFSLVARYRYQICSFGIFVDRFRLPVPIQNSQGLVQGKKKHREQKQHHDPSRSAPFAR